MHMSHEAVLRSVIMCMLWARVSSVPSYGLYASMHESWRLRVRLFTAGVLCVYFTSTASAYATSGFFSLQCKAGKTGVNFDLPN